MEFMAFKKCMDFLIGYGLLITTFISDRHISIASHMRKVLHKIMHYFDVWHLKKSETDCIILKRPLLHPGFVVSIIIIICALMLLVVASTYPIAVNGKVFCSIETIMVIIIIGIMSFC